MWIGSGGVGRDELEVDDPARLGGAVAVHRPGHDDRPCELARARGVERDVEEPRPGHVDRLHPGNVGEVGRERGGEVARRDAGALGELEGDVGRPVPVVAVPRSLDPDLRGHGDREVTGLDGGLESGTDRGRELFGRHPRKSMGGPEGSCRPPRVVRRRRRGRRGRTAWRGSRRSPRRSPPGRRGSPPTP